MENYVWMFNKSLGPVAPRQSGLRHITEAFVGWTEQELSRAGTLLTTYTA